MNVDELIAALEKMPDRNFHLDANQQKLVRAGEGPIWVIAGPGSGKTDSIVFRCIRLLVVDKVPPVGIILTTFTEKAANNLRTRIAQYMQHLVGVDESIRSIDYNRVRIDTLHGLCNDIMQEFRFSDYQNYRLLDEIEQRLFIMEHSSAASLNVTNSEEYKEIWEYFDYLFEGYDYLSGTWSSSSGRPPNRIKRAKGLATLFNRIVEDLADTNMMENEGGGLQLTVKAYKEYKQKLFSTYRCDFAHVQSKFLDFLRSQESKLFLIGDGTDQYPGVRHVLVDEYQDTNLIQEEIYFTLANATKNLCVVGDDDQALYRFRGGTVNCMVNFDKTCSAKWPDSTVNKIFLSTNYRSNSGIIKFYDGYIRSFPSLSMEGARVKDKPPLIPGSAIKGDYPPVAIHRGRTKEDLAVFFADMLLWLKNEGKIHDFSECVLLLPSAKRSPTGAGPFMDELDRRGIPYYNPRSRGLLEEEEIQIILGGMLEIIDPNSIAQKNVRFSKINDLCNKWREAFNKMAETNPELEDYVKSYAKSIIRMGPRVSVGVNLSEVFFDLLNHPPLSNWIDDPEISTKMGVISNLLEAYSNVPSSTKTNTMLGFLHTSKNPNQGISFRWRTNFYYSLLGILTSEGLNDIEDEIESFPPGKVPIMTIHQSKGLEFPIVFVYGLSPKNKNNGTFRLETDISKFKGNTTSIQDSFSLGDKVEQDLARLFFVAYSRAQYALVLLASIPEYRKPGKGFGGGNGWSVFSNSREI